MGRSYNLTKPACELLEAGCEDDLIAAVTVQSPAMVLHCTKKVRLKFRAVQAQQKRTEQKQNVWTVEGRLERTL
ncbi:MAG: hypothetical protein P8Q92_05015 [Pseudoprimorskyibacter sp.]|nr:hypothetical protein [Pseudoprimorskyibacter sp.]